VRALAEQRRSEEELNVASLQEAVSFLEAQHAAAHLAGHSDAARVQSEAASARNLAVTTVARQGAIALSALYEHYSAEVDELKTSVRARLSEEADNAARTLQQQFDLVMAQLREEHDKNERRAAGLKRQIDVINAQLHAIRSMRPGSDGGTREFDTHSASSWGASELTRLKRAVRIEWSKADASRSTRLSAHSAIQERIAFLLRALSDVGYDARLHALFSDQLSALQERSHEMQSAADARRAGLSTASGFLSPSRQLPVPAWNRTVGTAVLPLQSPVRLKQ
jgi:hypothetical protein